jgi:DNA-binding FrmR family transcriptional regulator
MPTLAQIYEDHAEDCIRAAARTDDPKQRDVLIHLAIKWREDSQALTCEPQQWPLRPLRVTQIYEDHAENCIREAAETSDAKHREVLLDLAARWREEAQALSRRQCASEIDSSER